MVFFHGHLTGRPNSAHPGRLPRILNTWYKRKGGHPSITPVRPPHLTPAQWAWHEDNPEGRRRKAS